MNNPQTPSPDLLLQPFFGQEVKEEQDSIDLMRYWRAVVKYKWLIMALIIVAGTISAVNAYSQEPVYRASATLLIEPRQNTRFAPLSDPVASSGFARYSAYQYLTTQKAILNSRHFA
jgi:polysaccharide biosynthesis transport protein